ncbi:MAG: NTP transferase domain-containing protein [Bacteroidales bacterium]|nr:NTP transferase domain-containing protein [Bacteroidales bacterium]
MQLVILSGGSGARLWPLSNNARSKQFLPLLEDGKGGYESMLQRVYRQLTKASLTDNVLITTTSSQKDNIINQIGSNVDIVFEPERRKTFPAVALAASYLYSKKGCSKDEVVVVMPCDAYTHDSYYNTLMKMVKTVESDYANLVLMGILPTFASTKFGYIIPEKGQDRSSVQKVKKFVEKPPQDKALKYLTQGAYWNGGVFAFRLGYMLKFISKYIGSTDYEAVVAGYEKFPQISFDHEISEKEKSVALVPFFGEWKDFGNWNILTSRLKTNAIGNAVMGNNNSNTHVLNELGLPIFIDGLQDVVVAASYDGILIASKDRCDNVTEYTDSLVTRPMFEERRWGTYRVLDDTTYADGTRSLTKSIVVKAGRSISYQIHHHRSEIWTFVDGEGLFVLDGKVSKVGPGVVVNIARGQYHAVKALNDLSFIEVQTGNPLVEEDIERFDFDWDSVKVD